MIEKIKPETVETLGVRALPTTPTAQGNSGGYSSAEVKQAFDRLTVHVIEKYNLLIDAIHAKGSASVMAEMPTGLSEGHTLQQLIEDITCGNLAAYLTVGERSLIEEIAELRARITALEESV